jgi:acetyl esterase/lipase
MVMRYETLNVPLDYAALGLDLPKENSQMTLYIPQMLEECTSGPRPVVVLCPGGGYGFVSPREGEPVAMQYVAANIAVAELQYSVQPSRFPVALFELASVVRWIRERAGVLKLDPARIIVNGLSAGGHLAASLAVYWNRDFLYRRMGCDAEAIRPNGAILCYPVISGEKGVRHDGSLENLYGPGFGSEEENAFSLEKHVGPHCPPTFLWHTAEDTDVLAENSLRFASALLQHNVSVELHLYPTGVHGLSLATPAVGFEETPETAQVRQWPSLAIAWIKSRVGESPLR